MRSGAYQSPGEVVQRALEMLFAWKEWLRENRGSINQKNERAFGQFERGEYFTAEQSRAEMARRKAEWLADRKLG